MKRTGRKQKQIHFESTIIIVCEGFTERYYFDGLKSSENLKFKIKPSLPANSNFRQIIEKANEFKDQGYDAVYCVLDLDKPFETDKEKETYFKLKSKAEKKGIKFIESMPCFEIWFLLHFSYSSRSYENCKELCKILEDHIPGYEKKEKVLINIYEKLKDLMPTAIQNAVKLESAKARHDNNKFPFTDMHNIIESFQKLESRKF